MSKEDKKIPVVEIFGPTIQGEGAVIGQQTYFIRFGLCDYKCRMCDSMHAVDPRQVKANATWATQDEIFSSLQQHRLIQGEHTTKNVTFSGGNPCIHDLTRLVWLLNEAGWDIAVETQGTLNPTWLIGCTTITCSPKGPGMGEKLELGKLDDFTYMLRDHPGLNMKVVIFDQRDLEVAAMLYERYSGGNYPRVKPEAFYLSLGNPFPPGMEPHPGADNSTRTLTDRLLLRYQLLLPDVMKHKVLSKVKFLPQLHVLVWGNKQGV
jgi:7-carboxy-7-deazaguanine synthase